MIEIEKVLNQDETVLWQSKPNFLPFLFSGTILTTIFALVWTGFTLLFVVMWIAATTGPTRYGILLLPHLWVGLGLLFGPTIYKLLVYRRTFYAITSKRVIFQTGVIGRDFTTIGLDKITGASVNVGLFDKLFGGNTGSIVLQIPSNATTQTGTILENTIRNVENPYEVFKHFDKVSYDVKTDIEYPNAMRPAGNPGYNTAYTPAEQPNSVSDAK